MILRRLCVLITVLNTTTHIPVTQANLNVEPSYTEVTQRLFSPFIRADAKCHVNEKLVPAKRANQDTCDGQNKREKCQYMAALFGQYEQQ